jgi:copper chaperone CopZ
MVHNYEITGMHCAGCVGRVTQALRKVAGVNSAEVSLTPPAARVEMAHHVPVEDLNSAVRGAGDYRLRELAEAPSQHTAAAEETSRPKESLYPLALIIAYIAGATALVAVATGDRSAATLMRHFMAGFFLVFSFFKLLDLRGFVDAYRSYDLVARAVPAWGGLYPFVELALGVAYLLNLARVAVNAVTLVLMLVGSVGVLKALLDKRAIRCACLGTALNLPMTTVTLVEDLGMAAMAAAMLLMR